MDGGWNFGGNSVWEKKLAKSMCERFRPAGMDLVRFTNSGTEANTTVLAAAVAITGKKKTLVFSSGYHGSTLVFPASSIQNRIPSVMNLPHEFIYAPYNNIEETRLALSSAGTNSLAAILVEPIQGSGGCRPASPQFLHFLREVADNTKALLIVDEVMASRLGESGYVTEIGIKADFLTLGKYLGGGMAFGAFGGRKDLMERFDPSKAQLFHPGTYNNNVFSMAAGFEGLKIFNPSEVERLNKLGDTLKSKIQKILIDNKVYPATVKDSSATLIKVDSLVGPTTFYVGNSLTEKCQTPFMMITGQGSMLNVRFSGNDAPLWQNLFYHSMLARNIYIATRGYTPLNLCLTENDIDRYAAAVGEFVSQHKTAFPLD
ncbi:hypothetical protein BFJ66_g17242 [Fusarium oxysporum f. sp. cepae]|uniref:Glutamate-1-semialdehyde 2,1-aminomutase n=1 Tax=Fusarium oxysporum f. sp. cepae TaxID=396571 RepID=A0A3L6MU58_FUSOX|nr:hypothetical protein BFJ65_g17839 [Fusarium oxysporum f. sp. cepae]RKK21352.1 hypothetical protein BFJ67_g17317 [Fusarium oxysporum f. sp. cepae]RKK24063.1 hypothetical protein BFJ66_g17242 [Fusarium oxysporum f. sp. cepae]